MTTYTIQQISNNILAKVQEISNDVFAVKISDHTVIKSSEVSANVLNQMSKSTGEYIFFYIKEKVSE